MGYYNSKASRLRYALPSTHLWVLGGIALLFAGACLLARSVIRNVIPALLIPLGRCAAGALLVAYLAVVVAVAVWLAPPRVPYPSACPSRPVLSFLWKPSPHERR